MDPKSTLGTSPLQLLYSQVLSRAAGALGVLQLAAALGPFPTQVGAARIGKAAASRSTPRGFAEKRRASISSV